MSRPRSILGFSLGAILVTLGCENPTGFTDVQKFREVIVDFQNLSLRGGERREFTTSVAGDLIHPSIEGRWSFSDPTLPVDVFIYQKRGGALSDSLFWSSIKDAVVGTQRLPDVHFHPKPGEWAVVFYNAATNVNQRAEVSAEVALTYFKGGEQ